MLYLGIIIFLLNAFLGVFTIYKSRTFESFIFGIFSLCFGIWVLSIHMTLTTGSLFWGRTAFVGAIGGIGSLFIFSFIFPGNRPISSSFLTTLLIPIILLEAFSYSSFFISSVKVIDKSITETFGPLMGVYKFYAPVYIFGAVYVIFRTYLRSKEYAKRLRIKYALLGISLFVVPAVLTNAVLPLWFNIYTLNSIGPFFSICMVGFISYAIVRHEFLDIRIIIQRGVVYTALLSTITGIYISILFTFEYVFKDATDMSVFISALITTILGIFGTPTLKRYFEKVTDPIFFKDRYDYGTVLSDLTDVLNKTIILETIINKTTSILSNALKISSLRFILNTNEAQRSPHNGLLLPIVSNKKRIGYLVVEEKRSGDPYTDEDKKLLETFTKQAGIALEKASLYQQVKEYASTLEKKVEERTAEIVAIQKEQEALMLEISHGLQTPLTIMKGELFFLKKQGASAENLNTIDSSIDRISAFIYRLLNVSQLETALGKERVIISLSDILDSLVGFFQEEAMRKGIHLEGVIGKDLSIIGNEEEIRELFSNLISNAIKYMRQDGEKKITLRTVVQDTSILVSIQDTGIGIKTEDIHQLFKKFYRVKNDSTKGIQGTGLGLAVCKKIVELHGGTITLESSFGDGTTIKILLPHLSKE
jgi:signal transduction histidine kinase